MNRTTLNDGDKVRTSDQLQSTQGFIIAKQFLEERKPSANGTVTGMVPGHGGDVLWVEHQSGKIAPYWLEELQPPTPPAIPDEQR